MMIEGTINWVICISMSKILSGKLESDTPDEGRFEENLRAKHSASSGVEVNATNSLKKRKRIGHHNYHCLPWQYKLVKA